MIRSIKVFLLKIRLKMVYLRWLEEVRHYDCGMSLAREMSHTISPLEVKMKTIADRLRSLGETVPKTPGEGT